jgi:hypothetical protein
VIERETVQEKIIHTTDHVHKVEHLNDEHHGATVAPAITMADFEKGSGGQTDDGAAKAVLGGQLNQTGTTVASEKPDALVDDMDAAITAGKLDATKVNDSLNQ